MKYESVRRRNEERRVKKFFINRSGKIFRYKGDLYEEFISIHQEIAENLFPDITYPRDYMLRLGWIQVGSAGDNTPIIDIEPTVAQINILYQHELFDKLSILNRGMYRNYKNLQN